MIESLKNVTNRILRKNERNLTEQRWDFVYKIPQTDKAEEVLKSEKEYTDSFWKSHNKSWKLPEQEFVEENGRNSLKMPFYKWEVMEELRKKIENKEDYFPLLGKVLELTSEIRQKYKEPKWTLKIDIAKRFVKYLVGIGIHTVKDNVNSILESSKPSSENNKPRISMKEFVQISLSSLKKLKQFKYFDQEYQIHWCLHLEHIRIDNDGKLVPIDFEHGANYPRRLKYQDEAYIYQNLLQYFPNHTVANDFLVLWLRSVDMTNAEEQEHVKIALSEKMLGGLFEMNMTNPDKFHSAIQQHMRMNKDFDKNLSNFQFS